MNEQDEMTFESELTSDRPKRDKWKLLAFAIGLLTSVIAMLVCGIFSLLNNTLLCWFVWDVIPIGALLLGLLASIGYVVALRVGHVRVTKTAMLLIAIVQTLIYGCLLHVEFQIYLSKNPNQINLDFISYIDSSTRNIILAPSAPNQPRRLAGDWGYILRTLDVLCFSVVAAILPLWILKTYPYCNSCSLYKRRRGVSEISCWPHPREMKRMKKTAGPQYEQAIKEYEFSAEEIAVESMEFIENRDALAFVDFTTSYAPEKWWRKKPFKIIVLQLVYCPKCEEATILWFYETQISKYDVRFEDLRILNVDHSTLTDIRKLRPKW